MTYDLIAPAAFGLEAVTARELQTLGFENVRVEDGRVFFTGDESSVAKANLWLWSLRDFLIMGIAALLSVVILVQTHIFLP
ncbi:MAG: class I SAM-dependent RNA methyltransferase, partial [Clostridia bacterium]|nr:class I SAM-dependent RNA methyltransferase [Clostridia bacterium]